MLRLRPAGTLQSARILSGAALITLAACGGGGGSGTVVPQTVAVAPAAGLPGQTTTKPASPASPNPTATPGTIATTAPSNANTGVRSRIKAYSAHFCYGSGCYQGAISASPSQVAQWADYVEPYGSDAATARAAGIPHVLQYVDFNLMYGGQSNTPADSGNGSDYLGSNGNGAQYWNIVNPSTQSYLISTIKNGLGSNTGVFSDDSGAAFDQYGSFRPASPAIGSASQGESATEAIWAGIGGDIVENGLGNAPDDGTADQIQQQLAAQPAVLGAVYEGCYLPGGGDHDTNGRSDTGRWQSTENSQLQTQAAGKDFICLTLGKNGQANVDDRLYAFASLLLTYDPNYSVLWTDVPSATNTGLFPENGVVPTQPLVAQPSNVSALAKGSVYVREYAACYNRGTLVGKCAVVVNPQTSSASIPLSGYGHAIALSGDDVFSGGTVAFNAAAPGSLEPVSATILFP